MYPFHVGTLDQLVMKFLGPINQSIIMKTFAPTKSADS